MSKFADNTKLCRAVGDDQEADILWEDLRRMFNLEKMLSYAHGEEKSRAIK